MYNICVCGVGICDLASRPSSNNPGCIDLSLHLINADLMRDI